MSPPTSVLLRFKVHIFYTTWYFLIYLGCSISFASFIFLFLFLYILVNIYFLWCIHCYIKHIKWILYFWYIYIYIYIHIYTYMLLLSHFSRARLCATPSTAAHQAPLTLGFSRQEHWSGLPFPFPMHESEKWKWSRSAVSNSSDPMDCSLPGSFIHGIFQARVLEWGAIAFSIYIYEIAFLLIILCSSYVSAKTPTYL